MPVGSDGDKGSQPVHSRQSKAPLKVMPWFGVRSCGQQKPTTGLPRAQILPLRTWTQAPGALILEGIAEGTWAHGHIMFLATRLHRQSSSHQGFRFASSGLPVIDLCHERPSASASSKCVMLQVGSSSTIKQQIHPLFNNLWSY